MRLTLIIEQPKPAALQDPLNIRIEGWAYGGEHHEEIVAIEVCESDRRLGETTFLFPRVDIAKSLKLPLETGLGFSLSLNAPALLGRTSVEIGFRARLRNGTSVLGSKQTMTFLADDYRQAPYGALLNADATQLFHREDIYGSGPSVHEINPDCIALVRRYLGPARRRVLDVGCGFGGYGRALIADGHDWLGVEVKASDCIQLSQLGLPHQQVDGRKLPFDASSFDDAICIEVLEHIEKPADFLAEIRRVVRQRLLVSVPNLELIPYLHQYAVVPWHLLEADHKNFFSRSSLRHLLGQHFRRVEVLDYAPLPLRTMQGLPLYIHLFAICEV
jgi:SAM-dependent methyltransferase